MGLDEASKLLDMSHLTLAGQLALLLTYFLVPTFTVLSVVAVVRRIRINRKMGQQAKKQVKAIKKEYKSINKKKQEKIDKDFESLNILNNKLGEVTEPTDKSRFDTLDLIFDTNGKAIKNGGNR